MTVLALAMLLAVTLDAPAGQCVAAEIQCADTVIGELSPGDCALDDGKRVDTYTFAGSANQLVTATVRPLSPTYTNTTITLVPPPGDTSTAPLSAGGVGATVRHRLPSAGVWSIVVGSNDPGSAGAYAVDMQCTPPNPANGCISQQVLCGQVQTGVLTPQNCRFTNARERRYQLHEISAVAGAVISIELDSSDFAPQINLYAPAGGTPIVRAPAGEPGKARLTHTFTETGMHFVAATSSTDHNFGEYVLRVNCAMPGCLDPVILEQPETVEVPYGQEATLAVDVHHIGPVEYSWYEFVDFPQLIGTTSDPRWQTDAITGARFYTVVARSPCGSDESRLITVSAMKNRRRATRH